MSGFEVVGVIFGVLPLIITAIEDYEKIVGPIVTYRQYSKALKTFTTELNVQRDIFQNECIWILSRFVDGHELEDMLNDSSHSLRNVIKSDRNLDLNVSSTIGPHYGQLRDILQLIKTSLDEIYEETKHLPEGLTRPSKINEEPIDVKAWKSHVKQKLKLSLKKDSLNEKINDLRHRNQAFLAISQQIVRFNASWAPAQTSRDEQSTDKSLDKIKKLRAASKTLHHHLSVSGTSKTPYQNPVLLAIESTVQATTIAAKTDKTTVRFSEPQDPEEFKPVQIHRQTSAGLVRKEKEKEKAGRPSGFRGLLKKFKGQHTEAPSADRPNALNFFIHLPLQSKLIMTLTHVHLLELRRQLPQVHGPSYVPFSKKAHQTSSGEGKTEKQRKVDDYDKLRFEEVKNFPMSDGISPKVHD
ncbi:hypothetical protein P7C71_g5342, partial [Lecanoromycetidae sp. Uapishka_2]